MSSLALASISQKDRKKFHDTKEIRSLFQNFNLVKRIIQHTENNYSIFLKLAPELPNRVKFILENTEKICQLITMADKDCEFLFNLSSRYISQIINHFDAFVAEVQDGKKSLKEFINKEKELYYDDISFFPKGNRVSRA